MALTRKTKIDRQKAVESRLSEPTRTVYPSLPDRLELSKLLDSSTLPLQAQLSRGNQAQYLQ